MNGWMESLGDVSANERLFWHMFDDGMKMDIE
jgi:hypothetical protein